MPTIIISSTDHYTINIDAIENYEGQIEIGKRKYSRKNKVYTRKMRFITHGNGWRDLYELMKHVNGDCFDFKCKFCKMKE